MEEQYSIERSIQQIYDILNHWTNLPLNGQPPYSPLPEETVQLLKEELKLRKKSLAEYEKDRKDNLKLAGLKEFIIPHEIKIFSDEPIRLEPIRLEPTQFEPIRLEPKPLKTRPQKKIDGWKQANNNPRRPVCRY
jgi:hypothetical protein